MKKQFYKVPLVKPSQRLQKQRQPEWKVCNVDDSEFKFGIEKEKGNVKERDWKWEYKGNKGRSNKKRKGEVKMEKKYELLDDNFEVLGFVEKKTLYRIKALRDFGDVKAGELGGYIEKEENLSHEGNCWVYDNARVSCDARVYGDAQIRDNAKIYNYAQIYGNAIISNNANVKDYAHVYDNASVSDAACVGDHAKVYEYANLYGSTSVYGSAEILGNPALYQHSQVCGNARISGDVRIYGDACVYGDAYLHGDIIRIYGNANIYGNAHVNGDNIHIYGDAHISSDAIIEYSSDYAVVQGLYSVDSITFFKLKDNNIGVCFEYGKFCGTLEEFEDKVKNSEGSITIPEEYLTISDLMKKRFERLSCR